MEVRGLGRLRPDLARGRLGRLSRLARLDLTRVLALAEPAGLALAVSPDRLGSDLAACLPGPALRDVGLVGIEP